MIYCIDFSSCIFLSEPLQLSPFNLNKIHLIILYLFLLNLQWLSLCQHMISSLPDKVLSSDGHKLFLVSFKQLSTEGTVWALCSFPSVEISISVLTR